MGSETGLLKSANTLYKQKNYPAAIKKYLRIIADDLDHRVLATQAHFNLNLILRRLWRSSKKEKMVLGEGFASLAGVSESKKFSETIERINELAASIPANEVTVSQFGFYQAAFCAFHKFYWKSSIKRVQNVSLLNGPDDVTSGLSDDQREHFLETLLSFLEKDVTDQNEIRVFSVQGSDLFSIDQHITERLGRDKSIWNAAIGLNSVSPEVSIVVPHFSGVAPLTEMLRSLGEHCNQSSLLDSQLKKKQSHSLAHIDNTFVSKADFKSLIRDTCNILDEDDGEALLRRPSGEIDQIVFREESFSDGKLRAWVATPDESTFEGLKACLIINGRLIRSTDVRANRPDVQTALGKPAGEVLLAVPKKYSDGESHEVKLVLSRESFCKTIVTKTFKEKSDWLKERDRAASAEKQIVFFASHNLKVQGAQTSLFQTVVGLKQDARLHPVVFSPIDGPLRKSYEHHGIKVIVQNYPKIGGATEAVWKPEFEYFASCLSALCPDVVVANTLQSYHSAMAGLALNVPTVLIPRESEDPVTYFSNIPPFLKVYADSLVGCVDQAVFVAQATRNLWAHVDKGNQCVIYNGLAISELERKLAGVTRESARLTLGFGQEDRVVLSVGTVCERKGQLDLLKAIPYIVSKTPGTSLKFVFVGMNDNKYSRAMQDAFLRLPKNLQSVVHLLPHTDDDKDCLVQQLYLASDMFVMNSIHESYPRVVLEALYFGLPVVTTRCFGVVEQVEEGKSGLFYEYGNHYELARKVSSVIGSESRLAEFSKFAYERFKSLTSYEEMVDGYKNLIYRLMEQ